MSVHQKFSVSSMNVSSISSEYRKSSKEGVILRDEDGFNDMDYGWRRINTLQHYTVSDRAVFRLIPRQDSPAPGQSKNTFLLLAVIVI